MGEHLKMKTVMALLPGLALLATGLVANADTGNDTDADVTAVIEQTEFGETASVPGAEETPTAQGRAFTQAGLVALGKQIFFDTNLSVPAGQSCATCHAPGVAFTDPRRATPTSQGAVAGRFGSRNSMSAKYDGFIPPFHFDQARNLYVGGLFWDGRAANLEAQAKGPFLNVLEMNNPDAATLIKTIRASKYAAQFDVLWGTGALNDVNTAFNRVASAIAAYERSSEMAPFNAKFDAVQKGSESFTPQEQRGAQLFFGKASCSICHSSVAPGTPGVVPPASAGRQVFTHSTFHNIGVPANPNNPFYNMPASLNPAGKAYVDKGLGDVIKLTSQNGKFRAPSLRNIALTAPYMHNGVFATLEQVVNFYNTRDLNPAVFKPEVGGNVERVGGIGNLRLTPTEQADLVAFLKTLSDR